MKKIIVKRDNRPDLAIYLADDALAHIKPKLNAEGEAQLLNFLAKALSASDSNAPAYVQQVFFNPAGNQQLQIYFSRGKNTDISQIKPPYEPTEFPCEISSAEDEEATAILSQLRTKTKESLKGESSAPVRKGAEHIEYAAQDSEDRQRIAAKKLYKLHNGKAVEKATDEFAQFILASEQPFSAAIHQFSQRSDLAETSSVIEIISAEEKQTQDHDVRIYLTNLAKELQSRIDETKAIPDTILANAEQLSKHEDVIGISKKIQKYTAAKDERDAILAKLATAIYNAAKEYYLSLWEYEKLNLDDKIDKSGEITEFNKIFAPYVAVDPNNYSMTSIEEVFGKLSKADVTESNLNTTLTSLLKKAYRKMGLDKSNKERDAIEYIIKNLNAVDPEHQLFPAIERITLKNALTITKGLQYNHTFSFAPAARKQLENYDTAYQELRSVTREQVNTVYETGTKLVEKSQELAGTNSEFGGLDSLASVTKTAETNVIQFKDLVARKNSIDKQLTQLQDGAPKIGDLDYLRIPIPDEANSKAAQDFQQLVTLVCEEHNRLTQSIENANKYIARNRELLQSALSKANETSMLLQPISNAKVRIDNLTEITVDQALDQAEQSLREIGERSLQLQEQIERSKQKFAHHTACLKILKNLNSAEQLTHELLRTPFSENSQNITEYVGELSRKLLEITSLYSNEHDNGALEELANDYSQLVADIKRRRSAVNEDVIKIKKDAHDILQCQLLVNALLNLDHWQNAVGTFGVQALVNHNNQSYIVPREIGGLLAEVNDVKNISWSTNPAAASRLIDKLNEYAKHNRTRNTAVNGFYTALPLTEPADNNTQLSQLPAKIQNMNRRGYLPQSPSRLNEENLDGITISPSTFWQRHPVLKKALLGALIGTIVPVVGTIIGLIVGMAIGKRDEKRARQQLRDQAPARQTEETQLLLLNDHLEQSGTKPAAQRRPPPPIQPPKQPVTDEQQPGEEDIAEVDLNALEKMVDDIQHIDPDKVIGRLPKPTKSDSFFARKQNPPHETHALENAFVKNLKDALYQAKSKHLSNPDLPALLKGLDKVAKDKWNPKEKNQGTRNAKLKDYIETLQIAYRSTCDYELIKKVLEETVKEHPQFNLDLLAESPLAGYGLREFSQRYQRNY